MSKASLPARNLTRPGNAGGVQIAMCHAPFFHLLIGKRSF